jgi:hypothetical protein
MSVITADQSTQYVEEKKISDAPNTQTATATFTVKSNTGINEALAFPAVVTLKIVPSGATYGATGGVSGDGVDYSSFTADYSTNNGVTYLTFGGNFAPTVVNGTVSATVTLPFYTTNIRLSATVHADTLVENAESFQFVISQAEPSLSLSGSTFVSSTVRLSDPVVNLAKITVNPNDTFYTPANATSIAENSVSGDPGNGAVASFKLSVPLEVESEIEVSIVGSGTTLNDYSGFVYSVHDASGAETGFTVGGVSLATGGKDVVNGKIILPIGTSFFRLATTLKNDGISETGESITFVVKQSDTAVGLTDSFYVQKTFNLIDGPQTFTSLVGSVESFVGTSAIDTFVVAAGSSVLAGNKYDVITGFSSSGGDVIKLGSTVPFDVANIRVLTVNNLDEASIVSVLTGLNGVILNTATSVNSHKGLTFVFKTGSDAYLLFDADYDGIIDTNEVTGNDTFIKLVGGAAFDYNNGTPGTPTNDFSGI